MFSCINIQNNARIESIAREWLLNSKIEELRNLSNAHHLVCPKCRNRVIYRNGEINRAHFAHHTSKELECTLERERRSPTESQVLGDIYTSLDLHSKYEVEVDVLLEEAEYTIDLLIRENGKILCGYLILDRGKRDDTINRLTEPLRSRNIPYQLIFTNKSIEQFGKNLSMTRTVQNQVSYTAKFDLEEIDIEDSDEYGHLQYFDHEEGLFKVYRGINRSQFSFVREFSAKDLIVTQNGELICSEDLDHAEEAKVWIDEREKSLQKSARFDELKRARRSEYHRNTQCYVSSFSESGPRTCDYCSKRFTDYYTTSGPYCVCHGCKHKYLKSIKG